MLQNVVGSEGSSESILCIRKAINGWAVELDGMIVSFCQTTTEAWAVVKRIANERTNVNEVMLWTATKKARAVVH